MRRRGWLRLAAGLAGGLLVAVGIAGCGKRDAAPSVANSGSQQVAPAATGAEFTILAGSELRDIEPALVRAARSAGVSIRMSYAGTLDIVERINAGEAFDAALPPNGAYPALALTKKPLAREKLFYSRVALGVKQARLKSLGWDRKPPSWAEIARAAGDGRLRFAMTNPTSSNTGMSALFAVASAVAGKTEDLTVKEIDGKVLTAFLSGQKLTAGSSGWLADAFVKDPSQLDAMVNYEAVILRSNEKLAEADRLVLVSPQDGVISADYPLMLLNADRRESYDKLVAAWKAVAFQREVASTAYLRAAVPEVPLAAGLSTAAVAELSFPNRLDVIDAVLSSYQGEWRRPSTSIFVLDISGSMEGERLNGMRNALKVLAGVDASTATSRYARFQTRERAVLIAFSDRIEEPVQVSFDPASVDASRAQVVAYADALRAKGGTAIYAALTRAETLAADEVKRDPGRFVSIVLLTDGENTVGPDLTAFEGQYPAGLPARVFPILFGEASSADMNALATFTGGRMFDGRKSALAQVFKEIRGYQ